MRWINEQREQNILLYIKNQEGGIYSKSKKELAEELKLQYLVVNTAVNLLTAKGMIELGEKLPIRGPGSYELCITEEGRAFVADKQYSDDYAGPIKIVGGGIGEPVNLFERANIHLVPPTAEESPQAQNGNSPAQKVEEQIQSILEDAGNKLKELIPQAQQCNHEAIIAEKDEELDRYKILDEQWKIDKSNLKKRAEASDAEAAMWKAQCGIWQARCQNK